MEPVNRKAAIIEFIQARLDEDELFATTIHRIGCPWDGVAGCNCGIPTRILAEVSSKRYLLEWIATYTEPSFREGHTYEVPLLKALCLPYNDHPEWQEVWR